MQGELAFAFALVRIAKNSRIARRFAFAFASHYQPWHPATALRAEFRLGTMMQ
jgi:hypothetical protein